MVATGILVLVFLVSGIFFFISQQKVHRHSVAANLESIAELKVRQIADWRAERVNDAIVLMERWHLIRLVDRFIKRSSGDESVEISEQLRIIKERYQFSDIHIVDPDQQIRFSLLSDTIRPPSHYGKSIDLAVAKRTPVWTGLETTPDYPAPHLALIVPLYLADKDAAVVAFLVLISDASRFLWPLVQSWPTPSPTAETLLIRRDGDDVLFLNELRHQKDTALQLRIPVSRADLPASMAVNGRRGFLEGNDYRGAPVVAYVLPVPETDWFMVAKLDRSEAFSEWQFQSVMILLLMLCAAGMIVGTGVGMRQRKLKRHYQESESKYRLLADHSLDAIWTMSPDLVFTYINPAITTMTGYPPEEWIGSRLRDRCERGHYHKIVKILRQETAKGPGSTGVYFETVILKKNNESLPLEIHGKALWDEQGRPVLLQGVARDISERKQSENDRQQLQKQLFQAQKMESVARLAGGVAHDFNNILGVIIGYTELSINLTSPGKELHDNLTQVLNAAERSRSLVHQLLAFARKETVTPEVLSLNTSVENMLKMIRRLVGEDIHLEWKPGKDLGAVKIDPSQIDQILANLCVNARDAIVGGGIISIETDCVTIDEAYAGRHAYFKPGDYITLSVSDDGCGMDQETADKIFDPFFTTKTLGKGTGLGLATVYGIVKQNNGFINVYSEPGRGTLFKIYLPMHTGELSKSRRRMHTADLPQGNRETILLVEDEQSMLKLAEKILDRLGYNVMAANSPSEALVMADNSSKKIALVMTDVIMPGMNGRELAEKLREKCPELRTLYMSGYTADVIGRSGVLEKGTHFIQKPFFTRDLAYKISTVLDREVLH